MTEKIRVHIVDDVSVGGQALCEILEVHADIEVMATASDPFRELGKSGGSDVSIILDVSILLDIRVCNTI